MMMKSRRAFASDNNSGVHARVLEAIAAANEGHVVAYGDDAFTEAATRKLREQFGQDVEIFFVFGGTGANVLGLKALAASHHAVVCAETAHINVDECGAPENHIGCKLLPLPTREGKLVVEQIAPLLGVLGVEHHIQPKVVSISQATEFGTVYRPQEIAALADFAHSHDMRLHMDGARLANAAARLDVPLRALTSDAGVDVLSFGGTKNGMMYGEAVVFFNRDLAEGFKFIRKQGMHLASKMRFIAAQFDALLTDNLWLENARHSNRMAQLLAAELEGMPHVTITQRVEANAVFATLPAECIPAAQAEYFFYVWNERTSEVRLMTSFDTTEEDVRNLVEVIRKVTAAHES